jgi:hypothetical protein
MGRLFCRASLLALVLALAACGGGGGGATGSAANIAGPANNVLTVNLDSGPNATSCPATLPANVSCTVGSPVGTANVPYVSVTVCTPGSQTQCQTIDHILVDTGSAGLRLMSSVWSASANGGSGGPVAVGAGLTPVTLVPNGAAAGSTAQPVYECAQFADGYAWGSVKVADVRLSGELAASMNVEIIGEANAPAVPSACSGTGPALQTPYAFGANGVLGVGLFVNDCLTGATCPASLASPYYYTCNAGTCAAVDTPTGQQVANPVASFAADNAGVILELPAVPDAGAPGLTGALVFGVGNASNNGIVGATIYAANAYTGNFYSTLTNTGGYGGTSTTWPNSFFDSGSNGIYLPGTTIPCDVTSGWFVPNSTLNLSATLQGQATGLAPAPSGPPVNFSFKIANALTTLTGGLAFSDLGAPSLTCTASAGAAASAPGTGSGVHPSTQINGGIDWGLPVFLGHHVTVVQENGLVSISGVSTTGPFWGVQ